MKIKRIASFVALFAVSLLALTLVSTSSASAADCTFTGGDVANNNMNDPDNWDCAPVEGSFPYPEDNDRLIFPDMPTETDPITINNNIQDLIIEDITFSTGGQDSYIIDSVLEFGLTVTDRITNNTTQVQTINLDIETTGPTTLVASNGDLIINGDISGSGNLFMTASTLGTLILNGNNSYSGTTDINAGGIIRVTQADGLGSVGQGTTVDDGASLEFASLADGGILINEPLTLNGDGTSFQRTLEIKGDTGTTGEVAITTPIILNTADVRIGSDRPLLLMGILSGVGGFAFTDTSGDGTGPLKLTADNTYTGPTTVSDTVTINGEQSSSDVTVLDGGTLKGTGTIGDLTVEDGGTVAPGLSPDCLNAGATVFNPGSNFDVEIGGTDSTCPGADFDRLIVTGTINLNDATLNVSLFGGFVPTAGQTFVIVDASGALSNTFVGRAENSTFVSQGVTYRINYDNAAGTVTLTVVGVDPAVAAAASGTPAAPNTGFGLIAAHPALTLAVTVASALSLVALSRRFGLAKLTK